MKAYSPLLLVLLGFNSYAQSDHAITPAQWQAAAPHLRDALECKHKLDITDEAMLPVMDAVGSGDDFVPPQPFDVFGVTVSAIRMNIERDGEPGTRYSSVFRGVSQDAVAKAARLDDGIRDTNAGTLQAQEDAPGTIKLDCVVFVR